LNSGKPNAGSYGFGWDIGDANGHRRIEHGGAWQGFTCDISRFPDDSLTVVVLTNLDSGHARPGNRRAPGGVRPNTLGEEHSKTGTDIPSARS
jgi:hypothetical protein